MKYARLFSVFALLHLCAWASIHLYQTYKPGSVLLVVDTSFSMKAKFSNIRQWIDNYESQNRYKKILIGTDKAMLGDITELQSKDVIFRTSFGKLQQSNLKRHYGGVKAARKILLSDGSLTPEGWDSIQF